MPAILLGAGCLGTPGPAAPIDGPPDARIDAPIDGAPDAPDALIPAARCRPAGLPAPQPWPPAGIDAWSMQIADVDGDDLDDLIVSVAAGTAMSARPAKIYVLYGPVSPTAPMYHVTVDVDTEAELQPYATSVVDVDGDECADLTVAGPPTFNNTISYVAVWAHDHSAQAWTGAPVRTPLSFEPPAGPVMIVWTDLTVNVAPDLAVADLYNVNVFAGSTPAALGGRVMVPQPASCSWQFINAMTTQPRVGGRNRLLAFGHDRVNSIEFDDVGTVSVSDSCTPNGAPITRGTGVADLDAIAPLDLISGGGGRFGAHLLAGTSAPVSPDLGADECFNRGGIEGFAVGDMGGTAAVDAVTIDHDPQVPTGSYACLVSGLVATPTVVTANDRSELSIGTGVARSVAIGNVNDAVRAWIVDLDGALHCVQRNSGANTLEPC